MFNPVAPCLGPSVDPDQHLRDQAGPGTGWDRPGPSGWSRFNHAGSGRQLGQQEDLLPPLGARNRNFPAASG